MQLSKKYGIRTPLINIAGQQGQEYKHLSHAMQIRHASR